MGVGAALRPKGQPFGIPLGRLRFQTLVMFTVPVLAFGGVRYRFILRSALFTRI